MTTLQAIEQAGAQAERVNALCTALIDTTDSRRIEPAEDTFTRLYNLFSILQRETGDLIQAIETAGDIERQKDSDTAPTADHEGESQANDGQP